MQIDELIAEYPYVYHAAVAGSWPSLREHGLRTTHHIVTTSALPAATAHRLLNERRPNSFTFNHQHIGRVTVRDHKPLQRHNLKLPQGFTFTEWLALLNERVFFWVNAERLEGFLKVYRQVEHEVLTVDTRGLIDAHGAKVRLSPINSGATVYPNAPERGEHTFVRIEDYPYAEHLRHRGRKNAIAELTVLGGVPDLASHVRKVELRRGVNTLGEIPL